MFFGKKSSSGNLLILLAVLATAASLLRGMVLERSRASILTMNTCESDEFRLQRLPDQLYERILARAEKGENFGRLLTAVMLNGKLNPGEVSPDGLSFSARAFRKYKKEEFDLLQTCYEAVWGDLEFFPVAGDGIAFENSWGEPRSFGGKRLHEGCDLFGPVKTPGYYPIVSITDGTVENIGWLPLGGYRIGIRSPEGGYFYYAHLLEYEEDFVPGDRVEAGDILGYMGNTGYGEEGTAGKFPVHLHLGIYIRTPSRPELSVNPYYILKALEKKRRNYTY